MKRIGFEVTLIFLSILLFLGSGGFTLGKMECGHDNNLNTKYSLGEAKDCCNQEGKSEISTSCCCKLTNISYKLDVFSIFKKAKVSPSSHNLFLPPSHVHVQLPTQIFVLKSHEPFPPPNSKSYLNFICSLLL